MFGKKSATASSPSPGKPAFHTPDTSSFKHAEEPEAMHDEEDGREEGEEMELPEEESAATIDSSAAATANPFLNLRPPSPSTAAGTQSIIPKFGNSKGSLPVPALLQPTPSAPGAAASASGSLFRRPTPSPATTAPEATGSFFASALPFSSSSPPATTSSPPMQGEAEDKPKAEQSAAEANQTVTATKPAEAKPAKKAGKVRSNYMPLKLSLILMNNLSLVV
jgi:hypothetical protein